MIWFTSDTHFGHSNILMYCNRPFGDVTEMNMALIENINSVVDKNDILYHLGDFYYNRSGGLGPEYFRNQIRCREVHLVFGNHDREIRHKNGGLRAKFRNLFASAGDLLQLKLDGRDVVMAHYAMRVWNKSHHGAYHLYGHSHASLPDNEKSLSIDVGVDTELFGHGRFMPYNIDEIHEIMTLHKKWSPVDHHTGDLAEYERTKLN